MSINNITIYGSGLIGGGWATHLLLKGCGSLTMYDLDDNCIEKGKGIIKKNLTFLVNEGILDQSCADDMMLGIRFTTNKIDAVENADLIIENGPEKIFIKQSILECIEAFAGEDTIITTSTSGLKLTEITKYAKHPERIIGAHPYHPVYLMPLLEMNKLECTRQDLLDEALEFFRSVDKKPVLLMKESDAYIGSRLMTTLLRESMSMIVNGVCTMQDIDDAFTYGPGMRYALFGIFTTLQLAGGAGELKGLLNGPMGQATNEWIGTFCNWDKWPDEVLEYFENEAQPEMNKMLEKRDVYHGKDNPGLEAFRDKGLLDILRFHGMI